jgi:hypothetical protein
MLVLAAMLALAPVQPSRAATDCTIRGEPVAMRPGDVCITHSADTASFTFFYPAAAAQIPALDTVLRRQLAADEADFRTLADYARAHPGNHYPHVTEYRLDADTTALLALSWGITEYAGGAHGWFVDGTLLWDRAHDRRIEFGALFDDPAPVFAEISRLTCPVFDMARQRVFARRGGQADERCPQPPYEAALVAGPDGRIDALELTFDEYDGYAGGVYKVRLPVTPLLAAHLKDRFRAAFQVSDAQPLACNSTMVEDEACRRLFQ